MIKIYPYYGAGDIKLGADISTTRASFGNAFSTSTYGDVISDYFDKSKIQVEYKNGIVVFIGVNYPLEVEYNGVNLSGLDYDAIYKLFLNESRERFGDGSSLVFLDIGLFFYFEEERDGLNKPLQVSVFVKDYYKDVMYTLTPID